MTDLNPYAAPAAPVRDTTSPSRRWRAAVLLLVAIQGLLWALDAPGMLELLRKSGIGISALLPYFLCVATFALGSALFLAKSRAAIYLFGASALMGSLVLLQWRAPIVFTGLAVALVACFIAVRLGSSVKV